MNTMLKNTGTATNIPEVKDLLLVTQCNEKLADMFLDARVFWSPEIQSDHY